MRKIEVRHRPPAAPMPCTVIITENDEDQARQLAEREAAGTYKPGWPLIAYRIVDPPAYRRPNA
ncbi:hypothetical protein J2X36_005300 [Methylobacterium sp. BE186]|uniref:hypothetical protein n=1 Tax=Methylobacterium sp. BE186 TaxID=2817715 RepID=UPI002855CDD8|nr:hypothetical protein [Methylobacterium sp. BE186]MDR7040517.1 hypothetical protein [Methylobacterium sp. BE186]